MTVVDSVKAIVASRSDDWLRELRAGSPVGVLVVTMRYFEDTTITEVLPANKVVGSDKMHYVSGVCETHERETRYLLKPTPETSAEFQARRDRTILNTFRWAELTGDQLQELVSLAIKFQKSRQVVRG